MFFNRLLKTKWLPHIINNDNMQALWFIAYAWNYALLYQPCPVHSTRKAKHIDLSFIAFKVISCSRVYLEEQAGGPVAPSTLFLLTCYHSQILVTSSM